MDKTRGCCPPEQNPDRSLLDEQVHHSDRGLQRLVGPLSLRKSPASPQTLPLYLAGHLDGAADVSGLQAEAGVKVFIRGNGCGVGGAGCLLHRSLGGPQNHT